MLIHLVGDYDIGDCNLCSILMTHLIYVYTTLRDIKLILGLNDILSLFEEHYTEGIMVCGVQCYTEIKQKAKITRYWPEYIICSNSNSFFTGANHNFWEWEKIVFLFLGSP